MSDEWNAARKEQDSYEEQKRLLDDNPAAFMCDSLPHPITTATTDADGRFSIIIPTTENIILAAHGSREVGRHVEDYYCFCRVPQGGTQPKTVMLSNQDLLTPDSARLVALGVVPPA